MVEKRSKPLLLVITRDEGGEGGTAYYINEGEIVGLVRAYSLPILLFGVSRFLVRRRQTPNRPAS